MSQRLSVYCSRIISICMFCIPEFGVEVTNTLWDPSILHMLDHSPNISPVPYISINRDFTGSTCSLFSSVSQQNLSQEKMDSPKVEEEDPSETEEVNDHASPATIGKSFIEFIICRGFENH